MTVKAKEKLNESLVLFQNFNPEEVEKKKKLLGKDELSLKKDILKNQQIALSPYKKSKKDNEVNISNQSLSETGSQKKNLKIKKRI